MYIISFPIFFCFNHVLTGGKRGKLEKHEKRLRNLSCVGGITKGTIENGTFHSLQINRVRSVIVCDH